MVSTGENSSGKRFGDVAYATPAAFDPSTLPGFGEAARKFQHTGTTPHTEAPRLDDPATEAWQLLQEIERLDPDVQSRLSGEKMQLKGILRTGNRSNVSVDEIRKAIATAETAAASAKGDESPKEKMDKLLSELAASKARADEILDKAQLTEAQQATRNEIEEKLKKAKQSGNPEDIIAVYKEYAKFIKDSGLEEVHPELKKAREDIERDADKAKKNKYNNVADSVKPDQPVRIAAQEDPKIVPTALPMKSAWMPTVPSPAGHTAGTSNLSVSDGKLEVAEAQQPPESSNIASAPKPNRRIQVN
jgi:hypothetical protein